MPPLVAYGVLGPLDVTVAEEPVEPPRAPVIRALLGALLLAEGRPVPVHRLLSVVWGDEEVQRGAVQVAVFRLRRWLGDLGRDAGVIEYRNGAYRLIVEPEAVDLQRFRILLNESREAGTQRLRLLDTALGLRRGPVLSDVEALTRVDPLVQSVEGTVRAAAVELAETAVTTGRPEAALEQLTALAAEYPLDELLHAMLITLLTAAGRPADALREYDGLRDRLAAELGVQPGDRVHQAYLEALARDDWMPRRWAVPAQLPPDITDFTGRDEPVARVTRMLSTPGARAVPAITGMGGVGKTALAVHVAHRLAGRFPDGQLYVDLRGTHDHPEDPAQVLYAFLVALGVPARAVPASLAERTALYRSLLSEQRVLVLLDNAASVSQVRELLPGSAGSAALVTSRVPLAGLEVAGAVPLRPLAARQTIQMLAGIAGTDRVRAEPDAATEIARLCENIPLAVRIVGARLAEHRHLTLGRLASALRDEHRRLDELAVGDLAIRTSFRPSYEQLSEPRRRLFRLLGLLCAPDVAAWVGAALLAVPLDEAETHMDALVDARLLGVVRIGEDGRPRYAFHDLVRLFARERAADEESGAARDAAVRRALGAWLWLAERAADRVPGPCYALIHGSAARTPVPGGQAADALAWFDAEHAALVAAVAQACAADLDEYAWDLAGCLEKYFDVRCIYDRWRIMHENTIEVCRSAGNRLGEAVLLRGLIEVTTWSDSGRDTVAMDALQDRSQQLIAMFEELGDERGMADACVMRAWGLVGQGATGPALELAERGLRLARSAGHLGGEARAHHVMALAYGRSQINSALDHLHTALDLAHRLGNPRFEATVLQFLGAGLCEAGDAQAGQTLLTRALRMSRAVGDEYVEAFSLLYLGKLHAARRDPEAARILDAALSVARRNRLPHHLADALKTAAELDLAEGRVELAVTRLEESVRLWRSRGWLAFLADGLVALGDARLAADDTEAAREAWTEARDIYAGVDDDRALDLTAERLGRLSGGRTAAE